MLEQLLFRNYRLGLISNASYSRDVSMQLKTHQLLPYFEQILISADVGYRKPHPLLFRKALNFFNVEPTEAVMIGDTLNADIIGSRHVGMKNIWIARWASPPTTHYRDDAIIPDRTIQQLSQIPAVLAAW
jgi:putative hydrolase of the HAD superfamily